MKKGLCIAGFDGKHIKTHLNEVGYRVDIKHMYLPYNFTPLEILIHEMERKVSTGFTVSSERMKQLIEHQACFVRDYVTLSENYDQAYINWMQSKFLG
uniref:Uncharacterized protein n=1 Tax=candidate division WWE3 bacterium TaxID=2053526 RepID=A0A7C4TRZ5_UNCKA